MVVAAHLEDLRMVEEARFHRARREAGRALAGGDRHLLSQAQEQVRVIGADLGLLRLQRDLATGESEVTAPPGKEEPGPSKRGAAAT